MLLLTWRGPGGGAVVRRHRAVRTQDAVGVIIPGGLIRRLELPLHVIVPMRVVWLDPARERRERRLIGYGSPKPPPRPRQGLSRRKRTGGPGARKSIPPGSPVPLKGLCHLLLCNLELVVRDLVQVLVRVDLVAGCRGRAEGSSTSFPGFPSACSGGVDRLRSKLCRCGVIHPDASYRQRRMRCLPPTRGVPSGRPGWQQRRGPRPG